MKQILEKAKWAALAMQRSSWEQGVVAQAFLEAGDHDTALYLAVQAANRQMADGRCAVMGRTSAVTDPCAIGEALIFACEQTNDSALIQAKDRLLHWALTDAPRNRAGVVYHLEQSPEFWVDSFYMLPPFLARAGQFDVALVQIDGYWNALFLPEKGLLAHRWNDEAQSFVRKDAWGVGNGWALAGMARLIGLLPESYAAQKRILIGRIQTLLDAALPLQMENGMFHDVLDDPAAFAEVNFGQMLAYTVYRGVAGGWLGRQYLPAAERAFAAACAQVDAYGQVQNVCGLPSFTSPGIAPEGQAFFILMCAARQAVFACNYDGFAVE